MIEQLVLAVSAVAGSLGLFVIMSSAVAAILLGPDRGPGFIRRSAWMFSRPQGAVEWLGFGITLAILVSSQLIPIASVLTLETSFGASSRVILLLEYPAAVVWLAVLVSGYSRSRPG